MSALKRNIFVKDWGRPLLPQMKVQQNPRRLIEQFCSIHEDDVPTRSSSYITRFFERCGLPFVHDGSTRKWWAKERLAELNLGVCDQADLPANDLLTVISELFEPDDFEKANARGGSPITVDAALEGLNKLLKRQGLVAYLHEGGKCFLHNTGSGVDSVNIGRAPRPLSKEETEQRERLKAFLDSASEDEFTERVLVPLFQRLGFHRVSMAGHVEKTLEFGKDLWMKYQLPTSHWLYFCVQVKRDKIDSTGSSGGKNVSTVLTQARMAIDHPIFDPEPNRKVLLDHIYIISANEITRAARNWIIENLDAGQRGLTRCIPNVIIASMLFTTS